MKKKYNLCIRKIDIENMALNVPGPLEFSPTIKIKVLVDFPNALISKL